jgi:hypothetical protein
MSSLPLRSQAQRSRAYDAFEVGTTTRAAIFDQQLKHLLCCILAIFSIDLRNQRAAVA